MSTQRFPVMFGQPGASLEVMRIDGSAVGATAGSAGLDGRGKFLCTISKSSNTVTINWLQSYAEAPYVFFQEDAGQTDTIVQITSSTASTLVITTVKASDNSPVTDADLMVFVVPFNTTSYVS